MKNINKEIWGRSCFIISNGKIYPKNGGEEVGSPSSKKYAKKEASRMRRREDKKIIEIEND